MSHRIRLSLAALSLVVAFGAATPALAYNPRVTAADLRDAGYWRTTGGGWTNGALLWDCSNPSACVRAA
jgi:hypothetical protein